MKNTRPTDPKDNQENTYAELGAFIGFVMSWAISSGIRHTSKLEHLKSTSTSSLYNPINTYLKGVSSNSLKEFICTMAIAVTIFSFLGYVGGSVIDSICAKGKGSGVG